MPTSARTRRSGLSWKVWWLRRRGTPTHFRCRRRGAHRASGHIRYESAAVERTGTRFYRRGRCLHRPEPAAGGSIRRKRPGREGSFASGGELFTAEKSPKRAGAAAPGPPFRPRGVHPKERHRPSRYAPPGRPVPYCPPLPGFARASRIGQPLRLQNFPLRPHPLPRNAGQRVHTAVFLRNLSIFAEEARTFGTGGGYTA